MKKILFALALLLAPAAHAATCGGYPYTLSNGQVADANQVMSNFNSILSCANSNLAKNGVNSDLTQFTNAITFGSSITGTTGSFTGAVAATGLSTNNGTSTGGTLYFGTSNIGALSTSGSGLTLGNASYTTVASQGAWTHTGTFATTGTLTSGGAFTASTGLTVTTGGETISAGGLTITLGGANITGGLTADSLAGGTIVAAGSDVVTGSSTTKAVTPASLVNAQTKAATGTNTLPGGLIEKWTAISTTIGGADQVVTWGTAFPTSTDNVQVTYNYGGATNYIVTPFNVTASGLSTHWNSISSTTGNGNATTIYVRAIGH